MENKIQLLDSSLINKIAAGEVIERPASVIKELLENSLDAGATEIKIEIEDAGLRGIKITDNGHGMTKDDLTLSFKRHTTSKIKNTNDLFNIMSLGFRGEALASVAEISNLKITTKTKNEDVGNFIEIEGGKIIDQGITGSNTGTKIEIRDLFYNVPARKKYLKSNEVEFNHILKVVTKYALIRENVSIKLFRDKKEILNSQKTSMLLDKIIFIYGAEIAKEMTPVSFKDGNIRITGFISKPSLTRATKQDQSIYVNQRYVKNSTITNAVYEAYKTLLFINRHPVFVLSLKVDPKDIDVNVHPAKELIRLKDEEQISKIVLNAIEKAFEDTSLIAQATLDYEGHRKADKKYSFSKDFQSNLEIEPTETQRRLEVKEPTPTYGIKPQSNKPNPYDTNETTIEEPKNKHENFGPFRILGQVNKTFIVAETPRGLCLIDQHAAEERTNYEKFMKEKKEQAIKTQILLTPKVIELNPFQFRTLMNHEQFVKSLGYDFTDFGENSVKLSSVPEIFGRLKSILFIDIINELEKNKGGMVTDEIEKRIIRFSCRASVKAGDELTPFQMRELMYKLEESDNPFSCPHGRPTIIEFGVAELEKKFKRTGW